MSMERLYKSRNDKIFDGVCGGIGQYFSMDPVLVRLLWVLLVLFGGTGVLAYLVAMIIIPREPEREDAGEDPGQEIVPDKTFSQKFWGVLLIIVGIFLLIGVLGPVGGLFAGAAVIMSSALWPLLVILLGLYLFFNQSGGKDYKSQIDEVFPPGKKLTKSAADRKIAGVCGGVGDYFTIDSNIIRIIWVMATLGSFGFGILAYLALAIFLEESE